MKGKALHTVLARTALFVLVLSVVAARGQEAPPPERSPLTPRIALPMPPSAAAPLQDNKPRKIVSVLDTNDKAQVTFYVPRVFEVKNANPYEVSKFIEDAVRTESGLVATYANPETGSNSGLILVVVPEYQLDDIGKIIARLDRPKITNVAGTEYAFVNIENRSVSNQHLAENNPSLSGITTDFVKSLLVYGGPDTNIDIDIRTNSLMITGAPSGVAAVVEARPDYDKARPQINIAVKVYEVDAANDAALGLDFMAWKNGPGQNLFNIADREYKIDDIRGHVKTYGYSADYSAEFFDFLSVKGKSRVINQLRGTVINGFEAVFHMKDQILAYPVPRENTPRRAATATLPGYDRRLHAVDGMPYFTPDGLREKTFDFTGQPTYTTEAVDIELGQAAPPPATVIVPGAGLQLGTSLVEHGSEDGLVLRVKPLISRRNIDLEIRTELETFLSFDDAGMPQVSIRNIDTQARASNGEEVVVGGMERTRDLKVTRKIPILGSIPGLGFLFGGEITGKKVTTIYELITPTIVEKTALTEEDTKTLGQVRGEVQTQLPADAYFFGQYLLGQ